MAMIKEILALKKERQATILAHNYQIPEVQDVADLVGDSLELSRAAARLDSEVIIFCGVDFMAETAAILSPQKKVILPAKGAWCPMAHMITPDQLRDLKALNPEAAVVCYVNSTAEIKAESDVCCTSANGVQVVNSLSEKEVIFVPDRNLAAYVARHTDKKIIPWNGYCYVHDHLTAEGGAGCPGGASARRGAGAPGVPAGGYRSGRFRLQHGRNGQACQGQRCQGVYHRHGGGHDLPAEKGESSEGVLSAEQERHLPEYEED